MFVTENMTVRPRALPPINTNHPHSQWQVWRRVERDAENLGGGDELLCDACVVNTAVALPAWLTGSLTDRLTD